MSKKSEEKLRRELEILKAQMRSANNNIGVQQTPRAPEASTTTFKPVVGAKSTSISSAPTLDLKKIRSELTQTLFFSVAATALLVALFLTESRWLNLIKFI